jgi:hypothetical protein
MLTMEDFAMIKVPKKQGRYINNIAAESGVSPVTVGRAIIRGGAPNPISFASDR